MVINIVAIYSNHIDTVDNANVMNPAYCMNYTVYQQPQETSPDAGS